MNKYLALILLAGLQAVYAANTTVRGLSLGDTEEHVHSKLGVDYLEPKNDFQFYPSEDGSNSLETLVHFNPVTKKVDSFMANACRIEQLGLLSTSQNRDELLKLLGEPDSTDQRKDCQVLHYSRFQTSLVFKKEACPWRIIVGKVDPWFERSR